MNKLKRWWSEKKWLIAVGVVVVLQAIFGFVWIRDAPASASTPHHELLYVRGNTSGDMLTVYLAHGGVMMWVDSADGRDTAYHSLANGERTSMMLDVCGDHLYLASVLGGVAESYRFELPGDAYFRCGERPFVVFFPVVGDGS